MVARRAMATLRRAIGRKVIIEFVDGGSLKTVGGFLKCVENRSLVELKGGLSIPFVGYNAAIKKIVVVKGNRVLYHNPLISDGYQTRDLNDMERMRTLVWGAKRKDK